MKSAGSNIEVVIYPKNSLNFSSKRSTNFKILKINNSIKTNSQLLKQCNTQNWGAQYFKIVEVNPYIWTSSHYVCCLT